MSDKIVTIGTAQQELTIERDGSLLRAGEHVIEILAVRDGEIDIRAGDREHTVPFFVDGSTVSFSFDGILWFADVADRGARTRARHRDHSTAAPMPGLVLRVLVRENDTVVRGAPLLILEAMKMEHQIVAPRDGRVAAIRCGEGEMVQPGLELVEIEDANGDS